MDQYGLLLQSIGFLVIIVLLAYLAVRYGLRSVYRGFNGGYMHVIERQPLDPKSGISLVLVQVGGEIHLLGAAQGGVSVLATYKTGELEAATGRDEAAGAGFRDSFSRVLQRFGRDNPGSGPGAGEGPDR